LQGIGYSYDVGETTVLTRELFMQTPGILTRLPAATWLIGILILVQNEQYPNTN